MGKEVYERTYQRVKKDGTRENWEETVRRVIRGNLSLVPENRVVSGEEEELFDLFYNFRALPAGRHLWMSGVPGRQFLFNCYVSGWGDRLSEHFTFTFNQLMEGGGVGANYSAKHVGKYQVSNLVRVHLICDENHPNYEELHERGLLSTKYSMEDASDAFDVEDSREGWTRTLGWIIDCAAVPTYTEPCFDLIVNLSPIRASGLPIKTFGGTSAGPVPFAKMLKEVSHRLNDMFSDGVTGPHCMEIDHAIATCVVSGNVRRSARMSIMHWKDPYIEWFLRCKESGYDHWSTNISVEIDDEFIHALNEDRDSQGISGNNINNMARTVYRSIAEGMLRNGEPGIWNSDLANVGEPNLVISTNPCGEIALEGWENCNLGHVNLSAFVDGDGIVDYDGLARAHELMARFLIRATYGDITNAKTRVLVDRNRRIGVGHFGFAGFLGKQGIRWSESWKYDRIRLVLSNMKSTVNNAARAYSHELRIPTPVKTTTLAPTGSIAKLSGDEPSMNPIYAKHMIQRIRFSTVDEFQRQQVRDYELMGYSILPDPQVPNTMVVEIPVKNPLVSELESDPYRLDKLEDASEISFENHLAVQAMYQEYYVDNSISYTINVNPGVYSVSDIMRSMQPYLTRIKGTTVFPERSFEAAPMERVTPEEFSRLRGSQRVLDTATDCGPIGCPVR